MTPEKISISPDGKVYQGDRQNESDIEYIRKDAFIEKACDWLRNNLVKETSVIASGTVSINFKNAIEEFKKAMKL